jgi:tripartite ATP-independent transporter DctP family solute receptor
MKKRRGGLYKMKKHLSVFVLSLSLIFLMTGCGAGSTETTDQNQSNQIYAKTELVMAVNGTDIQIDTKVAKKFAELVEEASDGQVTIDVFPNDQLAGGNATKGIEMIAGGGVDLAAYATSTLSVIDQKISVGTIPWSFDSYEDASNTIDTTGCQYYSERLSKKGITYLGSFHNGFRQLTNSKKEIKTPEDMKGMKIRVPGSEVYMGVFSALGADPVAMSWSEVFTAIQQGTIDGQENGLSVTASAKMPEVQDYLTMWNYAYDSDLILANSKIWDSLDENIQQLLEEKSAEACAWGRSEVEQEELDLIKEFEAKGMKVTQLSEEELQAFKNVVNDFRNKMIDKYGTEACSAFGIEKE